PPSLTPRRPLRPALFPYPTLFRSRDQDGYECRDNGTERGDDDLPLEPALLAQVPLDLLDTVLVGLFQVVDTLADVVQLLGHRADRKSTRLNSSHVKVSYAVFCLKKKKKTRLSFSKSFKGNIELMKGVRIDGEGSLLVSDRGWMLE